MRTRSSLSHTPALLAACLALAGALPAIAQTNQPVQPQDDPAPAAATTMERADAAFQAGDHARAVELYRLAEEEGVNHPFLQYRLGYCLHLLGRIDEALPHHIRGARATTANLRIGCLYNAACAHALLGHPDDALRYLQYAIDAGYQNTAQVRADTDFESLRSDPRFEQLVAGIGVTPTLFEQLDFLLGEWHMFGDEGFVAIAFTFERPLAGSAAIVTTMHQRTTGSALVGMLIPDAQARTWEWIETDHMGTTIRRTATVTGNSAVFEGRMTSAAGDSFLTRTTRTLDADGRLIDRAENSFDDGQTWTLHHEVPLIRASAPDAPR